MSNQVTEQVPIGELTDTWNDAATVYVGIGIDVTATAYHPSSKLLDLKVNGDSKFAVEPTGDMTLKDGRVIRWDGGPFIGRMGGQTLGIGVTGFSATVMLGGNFGEVAVISPGYFGWSSDPTNADAAPADTRIYKDSIGVVALRHGATPHALHINAISVDASNYERLEVGAKDGNFKIRPTAAGTGILRDLHISGIPTVNRGPGILWNDAGTLRIG